MEACRDEVSAPHGYILNMPHSGMSRIIIKNVPNQDFNLVGGFMIEARDIVMAIVSLFVGALIGLMIGLWQVASESPVPLSELL